MVWVARYGEIFLKGGNRLEFEKKLVSNIKKMFGIKVQRKRNRLLVEEGVDLRRVFGLVSCSLAVEVDSDVEMVKEKVLELIKNKNFETFAVSTKRMGADLKLSSTQINAIVGEFVLKHLKRKVDLNKPELTIGIEFIDDKAYIFTETIECFGGLPVGVEGKVLLLVRKEKDILAGLLMMKRGCEVVPVGLSDFDISLLQKFNPGILELKKIKIIGELEKFNIPVLVAGDKIGEDVDLVVLEPLAGLSEKKISEKISIFIS